MRRCVGACAGGSAPRRAKRVTGSLNQSMLSRNKGGRNITDGGMSKSALTSSDRPLSHLHALLWLYSNLSPILLQVLDTLNVLLAEYRIQISLRDQKASVKDSYVVIQTVQQLRSYDSAHILGLEGVRRALS